MSAPVAQFILDAFQKATPKQKNNELSYREQEVLKLNIQNIMQQNFKFIKNNNLDKYFSKGCLSIEMFSCSIDH